MRRVACYVRSDLSYNVRKTSSDEIENIFVDIMLPKTKTIKFEPKNLKHFQ